jgi:hypothetical protein
MMVDALISALSVIVFPALLILVFNLARECWQVAHYEVYIPPKKPEGMRLYGERRYTFSELESPS